MFLEVKKARHIKDYQIELSFNNGELKIVDLKNSLDGPIFEPLKNINYLKRFSIKYNTLEWENGADFAPEYLYKLATEQENKTATNKVQKAM